MNFINFFKSKPDLKERSLDEIKSLCRILFIDDKSFKVTDILKKSGWSNTSHLKDIESLDQQEVRDAHLYIVDIQGVGVKLGFKDEGLGLILALKERYPHKRVIVYSAEDKGKVQAFHKGIDVADKRLSKHADPYEFQKVVEGYAREAFSLNECVKRIESILIKEMGYSPETSRIIKNIQKVYKKQNISDDYVKTLFRIENATVITSLIKILINISE